MLHQTSIGLTAGAGGCAAVINMSAISADYDASPDARVTDGFLPEDGAVLMEGAGPHVANIRSSIEILLATAPFTDETTSGWPQVGFSNPVAVTANDAYAVSYHSNGNCSADPDYLAAKHTNGLLTAPARPARSSDGLVGHLSLFPTNNCNATGYGTDVLFGARLPT